jgi:hypothetical protein
MTREELDAYMDDLVAQAPPLSPSQAARLAILMRPAAPVAPRSRALQPTA